MTHETIVSILHGGPEIYFGPIGYQVTCLDCEFLEEFQEGLERTPMMCYSKAQETGQKHTNRKGQW